MTGRHAWWRPDWPRGPPRATRELSWRWTGPRARGAAGAGPSGWDGEFNAVPEDAGGLKRCEYATIECYRVGNGQVATRVTVSELDAR